MTERDSQAPASHATTTGMTGGGFYNANSAPLLESRYGAADLYSLDRKMAYEIAVPFNQAFEADGNLDRYVKDYVNFFRAFSEAVLRNALPDGSDREDLVNRIYARAESLLKAAPESYPFRYAAVAMLLTRAA